jgi:hypothetical protein
MVWRYSVLLVLLGLFMATAPAFSQELTEDKIQQSHNLEPFKLPTGDAEDFIRQHLKGKMNEELAEALKKNNISPEKFEKLTASPEFAKTLQQILKDPQYAGLRNQLKLDLGKTSQLTEQIKKLDFGDITERLKGKSDTAPPADGTTRPEKSETPQDPANDPDKRPTQPEAGKTETPAFASGPREGQPEEGAGSSSEWSKRLANFATGLEKFDPSLQHSEALQRTLRDLSRYAGDKDPRWRQLAGGVDTMSQRWSGLSRSLHLDRLRPNGRWTWPERWKGGWLSRVHVPENMHVPSVPHAAPAPATSGRTEPWQLLLGLAGLVVLVLTFGKLLGRSRRGAEVQGTDWQLGPWPVDPTAVRTRAQLVGAFEYLSLLRLGRSARSWNHRVIASGLGDGKPADEQGHAPIDAYTRPEEFRRAAEELANLYEHARYAPLEDPFNDSDLAAARRDLCFLAGVPSA